MKEPRSKNLGKFIKEKRSAIGLTQSQVAERLGYTAQFITNWERGISNPPPSTLKKISTVLKIPPQEMYKLLCEESERHWKTLLMGSRKAK